MKPTLKLLIAVVCLAATTLAIAPAGAQRGEPDTDAPSFAVSPDEWATLSSAAGDGTVRVIVGLDTPTEPEGTLSAAAAADQRSAIASSRTSSTPPCRRGAPRRARVRDAAVRGGRSRPDRARRAVVSAQVTSVQEDVLSPPLLQTLAAHREGPASVGGRLPGAGKAIAILDTGVAKNHPMLPARS